MASDLSIAKAAILEVGIPGGSTFDMVERGEMAEGWAAAVIAALRAPPHDETTKIVGPRYLFTLSMMEMGFLLGALAGRQGEPISDLIMDRLRDRAVQVRTGEAE